MGATPCTHGRSHSSLHDLPTGQTGVFLQVGFVLCSYLSVAVILRFRILRSSSSPPLPFPVYVFTAPCHDYPYAEEYGGTLSAWFKLTSPRLSSVTFHRVTLTLYVEFHGEDLSSHEDHLGGSSFRWRHSPLGSHTKTFSVGVSVSR